MRDRGWDLTGAYQAGWQILVIRGSASYDGMCRPLQDQAFVFVRGAFAGTLSPQPMDSRSDGALGHVFLQSEKQLTAEYVRYDTSEDPLCCPSRITRVVFDFGHARPVVRPVSASTSQAGRTSASGPEPHGLVGPHWRAIELAGKPTPTQDPKQEAYLEFQSGDLVSGSDGCNRVTGKYQLDGDRLTFGQMAATQMACLHSSGTEDAFREMLQHAARLNLSGDRFELFDANGTRLAVFAAVSQVTAPSSASAPSSSLLRNEILRQL